MAGKAKTEKMDQAMPREPTFLDAKSDVYPEGHEWDLGDGETMADSEVEKHGPYSGAKPGKPKVTTAAD